MRRITGEKDVDGPHEVIFDSFQRFEKFENCMQNWNGFEIFEFKSQRFLSEWILNDSIFHRDSKTL